MALAIITRNLTPSAEQLFLGDLNGDRRIDAADAVLILRHSAGIINLNESLIELADVDGDTDGVGPDDAILVLKRIVHLIDKFPIELPIES